MIFFEIDEKFLNSISQSCHLLIYRNESIANDRLHLNAALTFTEEKKNGALIIRELSEISSE
jgi:hypothetical protein